MGFSANANFSLRNFTDAETKYNNITPIRGTNIRPLGDRRAKHKQIIKDNNDTYICRYYDTDIATFHSDGRIVYKTGGYDTISTGNIMTGCMPLGYYATKNYNQVQAYCYSTQMFYIVTDGFTINTKTGEVSGTTTPTKSLVDRVLTNKKREVVRPFLQFAQGFMEVLNLEVPFDDTRRNEIYRLRHTFLDDPETVNEDQYLDVLSSFAYALSWNGSESEPFNKIKSKIYRVFTVYRNVDLPLGAMQKY